MNDQQSQATPSPQADKPISKAELLGRIRASRSALETAILSMNEEQLTRPGPSGWAVKDHLAHLAAWEQGVADLLRGRPRITGMGLTDEQVRGKSEDEINALIYQAHAGMSLSQVMGEFRDAHRSMLQALDTLRDADLYKPYASFVRDGSSDRQDPVLIWITGNTCDHFDQHLGWIKEML